MCGWPVWWRWCEGCLNGCRECGVEQKVLLPHAPTGPVAQDSATGPQLLQLRPPAVDSTQAGWRRARRAALAAAGRLGPQEASQRSSRESGQGRSELARAFLVRGRGTGAAGPARVGRVRKPEPVRVTGFRRRTGVVQLADPPAAVVCNRDREGGVEAL